MALAAYIFGLGRGYGLETGFISNAVGWATWIGILGCLFVIVLGVRYGRAKLMALAMALTLWSARSPSTGAAIRSCSSPQMSAPPSPGRS